MLARIRKSMEEKDQGFTLIELLVVMIIIGILAAIAIPVFLSQREKARDTAARSDVSILGKEVATHYVDNTGAPTLAITSGFYTLDADGTGTAATPGQVGRVSEGVALGTPVFTDSTTWCVTVTVANGTGTPFEYDSNTGLGDGDCTVAP